MPENDVEEKDAPWTRRFEAEALRLKALALDYTERAKEAKSVARVLAPFAKPKAHGNLKKLAKTFQKARSKSDAASLERAGSSQIVSEFEAWIAAAPVTLRSEVGRRLKAACDQAQIRFNVVSREDPVRLRIPPFEAAIDFEAGEATLLFAQETLATCRADADELLATRAALVESLGRGFDPAKFHDRCRRAWLAARASLESEEARVEILHFLPHLALQLQEEKFRVEPSAKNYRGYGRARFAYDVHRLQSAGLLEQGGHRLCLGVATGSTAQQKKRVVYFENEDGVGEYKLTVWFERTGGAR